MEEIKAKMLGRLHKQDKTVESLFVCSCGKSHWIQGLAETGNKVECNECSKLYMIARNGKAFKILEQGKLL